jgi:hypothetical protein
LTSRLIAAFVCARVSVRAHKRCVRTSGGRIAVVYGAVDTVIAYNSGRVATTGREVTRLGSTRVVVVADNFDLLTAKSRITGINGTAITVIANSGAIPTVTRTCITETGSTRVTIITRLGSEDALPCHFIAVIIGAEVSVRTDLDCIRARAISRVTHIFGASDTVVTGRQIFTKACLRAANINGTGILVITVLHDVGALPSTQVT